MKVIKVILGVIIAISIIFFTTGLFIKETKYITKIEINKPLDKVFANFNDEALLQKWIPELVSITPIDIKKGKVGSSYLMIVDAGSQKIKMTKKILAYVKNKKVTFTFDTKDLFKIDEYVFSRKANKTIIKKNTIHRNKTYIMGCIYPYFKGKLQNIEQKYLDKFKEVVEK